MTPLCPLSFGQTLTTESAEPGKYLSACAICVREGATDNPFRVTVEAITGEGTALLGTLLVPSRPGPRVVAIACCPGAIAWRIRVLPTGATPAPSGEIWLAPQDIGVTAGLVPMNRATISEPYQVLSGVSGAVVVPDGLRVISIAAVTGAGPGLITISGSAGIIIPPNLTNQLSPNQALVGPTTIGFAGTLQYLIEVQ